VWIIARGRPVYRVVDEALIRGGGTLTLSEASVASGCMRGFGDDRLVADLDPRVVKAALGWVDEQIDRMTERMKASRHRLPIIAVGGGSHLIPDTVPSASEVIRPEHHAVPNAYGAVIAEASGAVDRIYDHRGVAYALSDGLPIFGFPPEFTRIGSTRFLGVPTPIVISMLVFVAGTVYPG
jgi:hypothetical protein